MQADPTAVMLDQLMRVALMDVLHALIYGTIYSAFGYLVLRFAASIRD